jgi:hypothetical protein
MMIVWVTAAKPVKDFKIWLRFNDGKEGIIDLQRTIFTDSRPIFAPLRNPEYFRRFKIEMDTLVWENELDLAPEFLYEQVQPISKNVEEVVARSELVLQTF